MDILYGKPVAYQIKQNVSKKISQFFKSGHHPPPTLVIILLGKPSAGLVYVQQKVKACQAVGIQAQVVQLPEDISSIKLQQKIQEYNQNPNIHAILVQLPLPKPLVWQEVISWIHPVKDPDCLTMENQARMWTDHNTRVLPCTPAGIMKLLHYYKVPLKKKHAVVVGRSHIVGLPMARLLLKAHATLTVCHSHTTDLSAHTQTADIVVVAIGRPQLLDKSYFKKSAIIIDVGIHKIHENGKTKLVGDVCWDGLQTKVAGVTPVPGGVGPMTVAMLLENTVQLALEQSRDT